MADHVIWLSEKLILRIHAAQLAEHGGAEGVRDRGLLLSALARPRNHAEYAGTSIPDLAAMHAVALACNHPFVDGNKRTAYVALELFLKLNGYDLAASDAESVVVMLALDAGDFSDAEFTDWVRMHAIPKASYPPP